MLNGLDLFSGIGGLSYSLRDYIRPIAYCEIDPYCQAVLLSRQMDGHLEEAPIWDDIRTFRYSIERGVDIIYGGFPCQDISIAGYGKGLAAEQSGLYWEIHRLAKEIKPPFIFLENVAAITSRGLNIIAESLAQIGYDARWCCISAEEFIDQKRERWFCLAKLNGERWIERPSENIQPPRETVVHEKPSNHKLSSMECWASFARSVRKTHGIPYRMDRIKALGNAVVPSQAKKAFEYLMGIR